LIVTTISIADNIRRTLDRVRAEEQRSGREAEEVRVIGITKTFGSEVILEALREGITEIGENKVQEAERKFSQAEGKYKKHLVGHLQTNKVKKALEIFDVIHSVDSLRLATKISAQGTVGKELLLEVNTSGESTKFGIEPEKVIDTLSEIAETTGLNIDGLMTIGPHTDNENEIRAAFKLLKKLYDKASSSSIEGIEMKSLSMGMTNDFELAIEEGATMVRIGRALFGERS